MPCDLTEPGRPRRVLRATRPDRVFHLAGAWVVGTSWANRADVLRPNLDGTFQLCEGLRRHPVPCLLVSSAEVYGAVPESAQPISETQPSRPSRPTPCPRPARSCTPATTRAPRGCRSCSSAPSTTSGPGRRRGFVWSDIARQVAAIEQGRRPPVLEVGTMTTRRDFTDVRDVVRAYWLALAQGDPGRTYNVASGRAVSIQEVVDGFLALAARPIEVRGRRPGAPDRPAAAPRRRRAGSARGRAGSPSIPLSRASPTSSTTGAVAI